MSERTHVVVNGKRVACGKKVKLHEKMSLQEIRKLVVSKREAAKTAAPK